MNGYLVVLMAMRRKRPEDFSGFGFDDDFFEEFDKIEEMMRQMLESHFKEFEKGSGESEGFAPRVYGFTLSFGPEGKKEFKEFASQAATSAGTRQVVKQKDRKEPLVDVINHPDSVTVVAELPGVEEKHLFLKPFPKQLTIRVTDPDRLFAKTLALPAEVLWDSMEHRLKNGILEVTLRKKK